MHGETYGCVNQRHGESRQACRRRWWHLITCKKNKKIDFDFSKSCGARVACVKKSRAAISNSISFTRAQSIYLVPWRFCCCPPHLRCMPSTWVLRRLCITSRLADNVQPHRSLWTAGMMLDLALRVIWRRSVCRASGTQRPQPRVRATRSRRGKSYRLTWIRWSLLCAARNAVPSMRTLSCGTRHPSSQSSFMYTPSVASHDQ